MITCPVQERTYFQNEEPFKTHWRRVLAALADMEAGCQELANYAVVSIYARRIQIILCKICGMALSSVCIWCIALASITAIERKDARWFIDQVACNPH